MSRKPFIAGNWKMNLTIAEGVELAKAVAAVANDAPTVDVAVCPTFVSVAKVADAVKGTALMVGAQDTFWETKGAWTRQIAPNMLADAGCQWVIVGHSETRGRFGGLSEETQAKLAEVPGYFGESDKSVNMKAKAIFAAGLLPIIACGELPSEYEAGKTDEVVAGQIRADIAGFTEEQAMKMVIAYEPVWAIGTGNTCDPQTADKVCGVIRNTVKEVYGEKVAEAVRIQYGGSVKPGNAKELLSMPNIDGALVGGAALKAADFAGIIEAAK